MCIFGSQPQSPEPQAIQQPAKLQDPNVQKAGQDAQKRLRAAAGSASTILTQGAQTVPTTGKTLLGQ